MTFSYKSYVYNLIPLARFPEFRKPLWGKWRQRMGIVEDTWDVSGRAAAVIRDSHTSLPTMQCILSK